MCYNVKWLMLYIYNYIWIKKGLRLKATKVEARELELTDGLSQPHPLGRIEDGFRSGI